MQSFVFETFRKPRVFFRQVALTCVALGFFSLYVAPTRSSTTEVAMLVIGALLLMTGVGATIYDYLQYDRRVRQEDQDEERGSGFMKSRATTVAANVTATTSIRDLLSLEKIAADQNSIFGKQALEDALKSELKLYEAERRLASIQHNLDVVRNRIDREIDALGRRGRVNLAIGSAFAICGIAVLGVLAINTSVQNWNELLRDFFPRLTFVIFVEILSYFFLNLYRQGMYEIKYFQNELTTFESRCLALEGALSLGDQSLIGAICKDLSLTERNFVLRKGETTVDMRLREIADKQISPTIGELKKLGELVGDLSRKLTPQATQHASRASEG
jgi:hypothetical protein